MNVIIKYIKFQHMYGRVVATGQLQKFDPDSQNGEVLLQGSVAQMLQMVEAQKMVIVNSQEVLDILVRKGGFGA